MSGNNYPKFVKRLARLIPDRLYIQLRYFMKFRRFCDLRDPKTYNEKLQWMKLNYRVPGEWMLVDKFEVKSHVVDQIGGDYVIPTLGLYNSADEIDLDALPNSFVLKCTHDSGGVVLVPDKSKLDTAAAQKKLQLTLEKNYFYGGREPHYREITPRIIAEPFLRDDAAGQLFDYKFFCFDGKVKALFIASDRASGNVKFDYFDADFHPLDIRQPYPKSAVPPQKPERYDEMLSIARRLSRGHPHVRVDLYQVDGRVYFGELTFYHFGGMEPFTPKKWDRVFGDWLTLPEPVGGRRQ
jgi:hypothetical protein